MEGSEETDESSDDLSMAACNSVADGIVTIEVPDE
jgi:hypothetical protein